MKIESEKTGENERYQEKTRAKDEIEKIFPKKS